ncbi:MAG: hypothetical protein KC561_02410 [Myxococcales bacterium]|nr:hypothetical protein [Myxococcales bacterium]
MPQPKTARLAPFIFLTPVLLWLAVFRMANPAEVRADEDVVYSAPVLERDDSFIRGIALGLYDKRPGADYDDELEEIAEHNANTVSLVVTWSQQDLHSMVIGPDDEETRPDEAVIEAIEDAHDEGLHVLLFPILKLRERGVGHWRGVIHPVDASQWFASYTEFILHYARMAEAHGVEYLSIGSELGTMEVFEEEWLQLIGQVREVFSGKLTYSANWDHYDHPTFWDALDLIGMTGYYELAESADPPPNVGLVAKAWEPIVERLVAFSQEHQRPFIFTELGYYSQRTTAWRPWDYTMDGEVDLESQRACYQAFYEVWRDVPEFNGVFFWHWYGDGGPYDNSYNPRDKPAAELIEFWYGSYGGMN